jgi:hypothetical protein
MHSCAPGTGVACGTGGRRGGLGPHRELHSGALGHQLKGDLQTGAGSV